MSSLNHEPFERKFRLHKIEFELVADFQLDDMKKRESVQVRTHSPIAPAAQVGKYAIGMQAGEEYPPVVLWGDIIIDGNTRIAAARKIGRNSLPAYILKCRNERQAIEIGASLNNLNGRSMSDIESFQAAEAFIADGMRDDFIARELQVNVTKVRRWRQEKETWERAERLGIADQVRDLTAGRRQALSTITHDEPFRETVAALDGRNPTNEQFKELLDAVRTASSDSDAVAQVRYAADDWEPAGKYRTGQGPASTAKTANRSIGSLIKHDPSYWVDATLADEQLPKWEALAALAQHVVEEYRRLRGIAA